MALDAWLLEVLACPRCLSPLRETETSLVCTATAPDGCGLVYPVRDGIPVLLIDEATSPDPSRVADSDGSA